MCWYLCLYHLYIDELHKLWLSILVTHMVHLVHGCMWTRPMACDPAARCKTCDLHLSGRRCCFFVDRLLDSLDQNFKSNQGVFGMYHPSSLFHSSTGVCHPATHGLHVSWGLRVLCRSSATSGWVALYGSCGACNGGLPKVADVHLGG